MTDTTTESTPMARLRALVSEHRVRMEAQVDARRRAWEARKRVRQDAERLQAVNDAHEFVRFAFPRTLAQVAQVWQGYPGVDDHMPPLAPCAVTYLGEGYIAHYITDEYGRGRVTLVRPCACGNFQESVLGNDNDLALLLDLDQRTSKCLYLCTEHLSDVVVEEMSR